MAKYEDDFEDSSLEDGEIREEHSERSDANSCAAVASGSAIPDEEVEVDRMDSGFHEQSSEALKKVSDMSSSEDEETLRRAVIMSTRRNRATRATTSAGEGTPIVQPKGRRNSQDRFARNSQDHTGLRSKEGRRSSRSEKTPSSSRRFSGDGVLEPITITVMRKSAAAPKSASTKNVAGSSVEETFVGSGIVQEQHRSLEERLGDLLHDIRLRVDANTNLNTRIGFEDNCEQVDMDIDSDRDSQSRQATTSDRGDGVIDGVGEGGASWSVGRHQSVEDNDDEVEMLRATLLAQVKRNRDENQANKENRLEDGELETAGESSTSSALPRDNSSAAHSAEIPITVPLLGSSGLKERSPFERGSRKRSRNEHEDGLRYHGHAKRSGRSARSSSSGLDADGDDRTHSERRRESRNRSSQRGSGEREASQKPDLADFTVRTVDEWKELLNLEQRERRKLESELRHCNSQRDDYSRRRERFMDRALRCSRQVGLYETKGMALRDGLEAVKGRLEFYEKNLEKAQTEEARKEAQRKRIEREILKRMTERASWNMQIAKDNNVIEKANQETTPATTSNVAPLNTLADISMSSLVSLDSLESSPERDRLLEEVEGHPEGELDETEEPEVTVTASIKTTMNNDKRHMSEVASKKIMPVRSDTATTSKVDGEGGGEGGRGREGDAMSCSPSRGATFEMSDSEGGEEFAEVPGGGDSEVAGGDESPTQDDELLTEQLVTTVVDGIAEGRKALGGQGGGRREIRRMACGGSDKAAKDGDLVVDEAVLSELRNNPLIMFSGYRLCSSFPFNMIQHRAISNKLDPLKPLCPYQLFGKCVDETCRWQHECDYVMSNEELICSVLAHCPSLCPPNKMFSEFAREILRQQSPKSVGEIVMLLLARLPDSERVISACEMAARCDLPVDNASVCEEDVPIEYECSTDLMCAHR